MTDKPRFIELCAIDNTRLILAWQGEQIVYVTVPFDRKVDLVGRYALAAEELGSGIQPVRWRNVYAIDAEFVAHGHADLGGPSGFCVARAMHVALSPKQERNRKASSRIWCPVESAVAGWAWIHEGVDPGSDKPTANRGLILHVETGMRIWQGRTNVGKPLLKALRARHPNAFAGTPFGTTPARSPEVEAVKVTLLEFESSR